MPLHWCACMWCDVFWCVDEIEGVRGFDCHTSKMLTEVSSDLVIVRYSTTNKNPETDIGVQPEDHKSKAAKPLESSYLYLGSDKQRGSPVFSWTADCNAPHQTSNSKSSCLLLLYIPLPAQPYPSCLHLPRAVGIKGMWLPSAGSTFVWILFFF